jgi:hypothetical protein
MEESLARAREFGEQWWEAGQLCALAEMTLEQSDLERADRLCRDGLAIAIEIGDRLTAVYCVALLAGVAARRRDRERAGRLWGGIAALERAGDPPLHPQFPAALGAVAGSLEQAVAAGPRDAYRRRDRVRPPRLSSASILQP